MNTDVNTSDITIRIHTRIHLKANEKGGEDPKQYTVLLEEAKMVTQILKPKLRSKQ